MVNKSPISDKHQDAEKFANILRKTKLQDSSIFFGNFILRCKRGVSDKIQYNQSGFELLDNEHEYTFNITDGLLQLSIQLYENTNSHYRLFAYTRVGSVTGMTFSVNLTTEKETDNVIFLTQKVKFAEQYEGSKKIAQSHRRQKQIVFSDIIRKLGFEVTENNDIILGIFDPETNSFVNTSADRFLNDFIVVSLLKGHFMGNKGYELEILPSFKKTIDIFESPEDEIETLPQKIIEQKSKRTIPLSLRYKVLKRDNSKCMACGRSPRDNGVILHIDHKLPFSLGGLTTLENLQTLCKECNISKSNKFIDK